MTCVTAARALARSSVHSHGQFIHVAHGISDGSGGGFGGAGEVQVVACVCRFT
jgi:hypothetical protein